MAETIVEVRNLKQHFRINSYFTVKAVDGISFFRCITFYVV